MARLDERIARSPVGVGWIERQNFADACASLWIDGELVHLEDLVLHDATRDIRTPTHELTIARDVLRTRRRISGQSPAWALTAEGIRILRQTSDIAATGAEAVEPAGIIRRAAAVKYSEGEGRTATTSKIFSVLILPPSIQCSPDRRRRSKTRRVPAALVAKTKIR